MTPCSPDGAPRRCSRWGCSSAVLTGCGFEGAASIPLPGGEGSGDDAYQVQVEFSDVLDLVAAVGRQGRRRHRRQRQRHRARGLHRPRHDQRQRRRPGAGQHDRQPAPDQPARREVRQPRPAAESEADRRPLRDGALISLEDTTRSAEIEEVLGALSLVLNGGSLEQLQVINKEVVAALDGREPQVKSALNQLDTFVGGLDAQKEQIVRALDSLDRLSTTLVAERQTIATALEDIPAGVEVLDAQREDLVALLTGLDRLGDVAVRVIEQSKDNTVADLRALQPILAQLNAAGKNFPDALELLTTYPFPRTVFDGIRGDYANLFVTLDLSTALENEGIPDPTGALPELPIPDCRSPTLPGVPSRCRAADPAAVARRQVPAIPARAAARPEGGSAVPSLPTRSTPSPRRAPRPGSCSCCSEACRDQPARRRSS
jgi:phospholipid/cholesterol/gamma-HCH transport system substrate-binding protein